MKFEGTVKIDAPRHVVWSALTDPDLLVQITPGVLSAETTSPNAEFLLQTGFQIGSQTISNPITLRWVDVQPDELLSIVACIFFGRDSFEMVGEMRVQESGIEFSAEIPKLPRHIPPSLLHQLAAKTIRSFFKNLKSAIEHKQH